jgi:hypothetical protein
MREQLKSLFIKFHEYCKGEKWKPSEDKYWIWEDFVLREKCFTIWKNKNASYMYTDKVKIKYNYLIVPPVLLILLFSVFHCNVEFGTKWNTFFGKKKVEN